MRLSVFLIVLMLLGQASAQLVEVQSVRAWAPTATIKPIRIEVKVCNRSEEESDGGVLNLVLTPQARNRRQDTPGLLDPTHKQEYLDPIAPGQTRTFTFETPYFSRSAFSSGNGALRIENIIPGICQWTTVNYQVFLVGPPAQFCPRKKP